MEVHEYYIIDYSMLLKKTPNYWEKIWLSTKPLLKMKEHPHILPHPSSGRNNKRFLAMLSMITYLSYEAF